MFEKTVKKKLLHALSHTEKGTLSMTSPEGDTHCFQGQAPGRKANMQIKDWRVFANLALKGDVGFAEDYRDGYWSTSDLPALLIFALDNDRILDRYIKGSFFYRKLSGLMYLTKRNTIKGSRKNIHAHYDLGNDFYSLWLDESMTYSSAIFDEDTDTLQSAQLKKYNHILNKIPKQGQLLEIGCGWGGFAQQAMSHGDYAYKGITISKEQQTYAQNRLKNNAMIALEDYRIQQGQYDIIVSIEMIEAAGKAYWPTYFKQLKARLKPHGKIILQSILIADELFDDYDKGADMIRTFIFPGGMLLSMAVLQHELTKAGLKSVSQQHFGLDYATTLSHWLRRFNDKKEALLALGFDEQFQRLWQFYFASCIATFTNQRTDVVQMEITHA